MKRLIIFLIRKKLGLKRRQNFRFSNQKTKDVYFFTGENLCKIENGQIKLSKVSLNWLLDDNCKIYVNVDWIKDYAD